MRAPMRSRPAPSWGRWRLISPRIVLRAPEEDARVPGEIPRCEEPLGGVAVGLLAELDHAVDGDAVAGLQQRSALDIPISGLGPGRLDAERDQRGGVGVDDRDGRFHGRQERVDRTDDVIGGHHDHRPLGIAVSHDLGGQTDARGGVARAGLGDYVRRRQVGKLSPGRLGLIGPRDDQHPLGGHQGGDPGHGLLEHRRLAVQRKELLGAIAAALGPEPRAAAAGHDDRKEHVSPLTGRPAPSRLRRRPWSHEWFEPGSRSIPNHNHSARPAVGRLGSRQGAAPARASPRRDRTRLTVVLLLSIQSN